ncbi:MAG: hypothetical protein ACI93R_004061 [Flavobacteriales bacterium]|jgi:hypothetical protein
MNLYIYVDGTDLEEIEEKISSSISSWLSSLVSGTKEGKKNTLVFVNQRTGAEHGSEGDAPGWNLGVNLKVKSKRELKEPLNTLYLLAKEHKRDFVIGIINTKTGVNEDVCFFGHEEGRPDIYEVANYLGL